MKMHGIGIDKAKQMLAATTQKGVRTAVFPINKRYRVDHLDLHRTRLKDPSSVEISSNRPYGDNATITVQAVTRENHRRALHVQ